MTDTKSVQRIAWALAAMAFALAACAGTANSQERFPGQRGAPCSVQTFTMHGVHYTVEFAKNGTVQRYVIGGDVQNEERNNDAFNELQARFGPEAVNAPPLRIVAYKNGAGGMKIPVKTVDSCGRVTAMQ